MTYLTLRFFFFYSIQCSVIDVMTISLAFLQNNTNRKTVLIVLICATLCLLLYWTSTLNLEIHLVMLKNVDGTDKNNNDRSKEKYLLSKNSFKDIRHNG